MDGSVGRVCWEFIKRIPCKTAVFLIKFYRACISPIFGPCCRFTPTCSEYGLIAFKRFGFKKGFILTLKRFSKCHPGGPYGYDPVPEVESEDLLWNRKERKE